MAHVVHCPVDDNYSLPNFVHDAGKLILPDLDIHFLKKQKDENWIKAFEWHNNSHGTNLKMTCRPCYLKVYYSLKSAKEIYNKNPDQHRK